MADVFSKAKRSEVMSRVRGHGNKATELAAIKLFRRNRITGWRRHSWVFGNPDFIFPGCHLAIFVDGCFWHGCAKHATKPACNRSFWENKLARNKARDRLVNRTIRRRGWKVLRIWQHELTRKNEARLLSKIQQALI
ncbi:MAG TPA: very short patch repair endonuclease [Verrucomicrobiae bacterium]|nr:very short patch repair endonuclease [Verrucomicrobiae bacterium]